MKWLILAGVLAVCAVAIVKALKAEYMRGRADEAAYLRDMLQRELERRKERSQ